MNKIMLIMAMSTALVPFTAQAASVDLTVTGTIIPTSCIPAFANGSTVDLGKISSASLSATTQNNLPQRDITLQIACNADAAIAFAVTDNRGATKVTGLTFNGQVSNTLYYGLGSTQGVGIGGFGLLTGKPLADGKEQIFLVRSPANPVWRIPTSGLVTNAPISYSWGPSAVAGPIAASLHTFPMSVAAVIRPTSELPPISGEVKLDGSVTFDVIYL
ncbi:MULTISPECIES: DUF1120 domain-containing protein [unclassified Pseudomonas]|uniref:DUF1120 domain-containing protein n=1 Tax=unclassified Pseudomonas TaxID=196821 RepID=UPI002AC91472|nr:MULTISPECIES: DUF1120 domain-containing protein [unclassified Pseudomonas]MEB0043838.1 DUF1120 domain-containing protein [Pseudomonas sp. Dout3]MEB0095224.1 DUF1120 domain-containing protein [Pseudomonas sp. DC1.2]WPX58781.1 DUF1120 domain-containing protein [Pseudomonas sp. DC1.2]